MNRRAFLSFLGVAPVAVASGAAVAAAPSGFASGGVVKRLQPCTIGEYGTEAYVPLPRGGKIPIVVSIQCSKPAELRRTQFQVAQALRQRLDRLQIG